MTMIVKAFGVMVAIILISVVAAIISTIYHGRNNNSINKDIIVFSGKLENTDTSIKKAIKYLELTNSYAGKNKCS